MVDNGDPELIETIASSEPILSIADVVLQEHELTLVRSAVTLTVSGELEEPEPEEVPEEEPEVPRRKPKRADNLLTGDSTLQTTIMILDRGVLRCRLQ